MNRSFIQEKINQLMNNICTSTGNDAICSLSPSVYDTAWVSMVQKPGHGVLFPQCFDYLLQIQLPDGSWASEHSDTDGILSTLAAYIALRRLKPHVKMPDTYIEERCLRAQAWLHSKFATWKIEEAERVGFEVLVPNLLRLLEDQGVHFDLTGKDLLMSFAEAKMSKFLKALTGPKQTTLLHSLEALFGLFDFDSVKRHKLPDGSMLGSPSSTAAYLMSCSTWDVEAEAYLCRVVERGHTTSLRGGCPSAFPTTIFECSWALSILLECGLSKDDLGRERVDLISTMLEKTLKAQGYVVGFTPSCLPDVDDTAKSLALLSMLDKHVSIEPLIDHFEEENCFVTYKGERNPSLSANCNALLCLLRSPKPSKYAGQILKCIRFISKSTLADNAKDKWNISPFYSLMLVTQSFVLFLEKWQSDPMLFSIIQENLLQQLLPEPLLRTLGRVLDTQHHDGSWNSSKEETAYAIITLSTHLRFPWVETLRAHILTSIGRGKVYVNASQDHWGEGKHLWIEKVAYASSNLSLAYCIAASYITPPSAAVGKTSHRFLIQEPGLLAKLIQFFARVPPFTGSPRWKLELSLTQSLLLVPKLKNERLRIFPQLKVADEMYMAYIPFTWIGCSNNLPTAVSNDTLWEMMLVSLFNFQVDAYMETVLEETYRDKYEDLRSLVDRVCSYTRVQGNIQDGRTLPAQTNKDAAYQRHVDGSKERHMNRSSDKQTEPLSDATHVLQKFVDYILQHPRVLKSHPHLQQWLAHELKKFLLAHVMQLEDCASLQHKVPNAILPFTLNAPSATYYDWVHTTAANHTSCAYSFVFFLCLICPTEDSAFVLKGKERYVLESMCRHLATICRQYNDFGSAFRDWEERNLNSINFPEFRNSEKAGQPLDVEAESRKLELLNITQYEKRHLDIAIAELRSLLDELLVKKIDLFISVTNLYGDIYLVKDIGMRKTTY